MLGYGEDALTLLLVGRHVAGLLRALEGVPSTERPTVFYRPSFGRRATTRGAQGVEGAARAAFGEFDAIVGTPNGTYLVEVKWSRSRAADAEGVFPFDEGQARRHRIMRHYLDAWRTTGGGHPSDASMSERWARFVAGSDVRARLAVEGVVVPGARTLLADTLARVLALLDGSGPVRDVLLFAEIGDAHDRPMRRSPWRVRSDGVSADFAVVVADVRTVQVGPFILMPAMHGDTDAVDFSLR